MNWEDQNTVKKGNIGEDEVSRYFTEKGYIVYKPENEGAHPFDKLIAKKDKKKIFIAEVKTKARRIYYPDTGIDIKHYKEYKFITKKHNMNLFIYFVDEDLGKIYGNILEKLEKPTKIKHEYDNQNGYHKTQNLYYPIKLKGIIYFPLINMIDITKLSNEQIEILKKLNNRSYPYKSLLNERVTIIKPNIDKNMNLGGFL